MILSVAILTVSDRSFKGERADLSGSALRDICIGLGWIISAYEIVPDEESMIISKLSEWHKDLGVNLILTTGGTGFSSRDITPEATLKVITKEAPGIMEYIRSQSIVNNKHAILSRGLAGIAGSTLIVNLPGSVAAVVESIQLISEVLPHACELLSNDPNSEKHHKLHSNRD